MKKFRTIEGSRGAVAQLPVHGHDVWFFIAQDPSNEDVGEALCFVRVFGHWCCNQDADSYYCSHTGGQKDNYSLSINPSSIDVVEPIKGGTLLWLNGRKRAFFVPDPPREAAPAPQTPQPS